MKGDARLLIAAMLYALCSPPVAAQTPAAAAAPVPLTVIATERDVTHGTVTFTLQNNDNRAITAWNVSIVVGTGVDSRHGGYGVDAYREFAGLVNRQTGPGYLAPAGTIIATAPVPAGADSAQPVSISPNAAIFSDGTSVGESKLIDVFFEQRQAQLNSWASLVTAMQAALNTGKVDVPQLENLLATVNADISRDASDIVRKTFRSNLAIGLGQIRAGRATPDGILKSLLADAQRNVAATANHAIRR